MLTIAITMLQTTIHLYTYLCSTTHTPTHTNSERTQKKNSHTERNGTDRETRTAEGLGQTGQLGPPVSD